MTQPTSGSLLDVDAIVAQLMAVTRRVEARLTSAGHTDSHKLMFAVREVILDLPDFLSAVAALDELSEPDAIRVELRELAARVVYGAAPHAVHHLTEVLETIDEADHDQDNDEDNDTEPIQN